MTPTITLQNETKPTRYKYPRTPHLPWSPGGSRDDLLLSDTSQFDGQLVVITEKMDGENTTLYRDGHHARSINPSPHPSRDWIRRLQSEIGYLIPEGWRVCGENLFARHSIPYEDLPSYFMIFSIWDEHNRCLSWANTEEWASLLGLHTVPVLYQGLWNEKYTRSLRLPPTTCEGYVVRIADGFLYAEFPQKVAKYVRPHHVQTDEHWMLAPVSPNQLRADKQK